MQQKREFFVDILHIFILSSFALAQPLFDLLSRNAEFFVARHSKSIDVILLVLVLCVLLPTLLVLIKVVAGLFGRRVRKGIHYFMVAGLFAVIALTMLKRIEEFPGTVLLIGAVIIGALITIAYIRFQMVKMFLTFLSPALLIIPGLFLFNSPVFKVIFPEKDPSAVKVNIDNPVPVVMVVFDEFSVTSLMDERRMIDPVRYPNFAALARDAYWFRNATTVSDHTHIAIPAILTGNYLDGPRLPTATDYPSNMFTLLGGTYDLEVFESITQLCPERLCGSSAARETLVERMGSLLADLIVVYLHILLPMDFTTGLPVITQSWKDFTMDIVDFRNNKKDETAVFLEGIHNLVKAAGKGLKKDRGEVFRQFIRTIHPNKKPTLYFLDILFPHAPYNYLPSGKKYSIDSGLDGLISEKWSSDERAIIQAYQRYLLQVGFVDKVLGELIAKLKDFGLYEPSLIIITADHGVSFRPNDFRRPLTKTNFQDIMPIPLFIKAPNQLSGVITDRNVETIDILPTIVDVLNISWMGVLYLTRLCPSGLRRSFSLNRQQRTDLFLSLILTLNMRRWIECLTCSAQVQQNLTVCSKSALIMNL